jgi:hypothetical protein
MVERKLESSKLGITVDKSKANEHYGNKPRNFQEGRDQIYSKSGRKGYQERRKYSDIDVSTFPKAKRSGIDRRV